MVEPLLFLSVIKSGLAFVYFVEFSNSYNSGTKWVNGLKINWLKYPYTNDWGVLKFIP